MAKKHGICALCRKEADLELSHIVPKMVVRELKKTSVGQLRSTENPNGTVQDSEKHYMLCGECEDLFSEYETSFSKFMLHPYLRGEADTFSYDEKLFYFVTSVSWRSLYQDILDFVQNNVVGIDALECLISAEQIMRDYLLGKRTDIGNIENHIFFFDQVMSMSGFENGMSIEEARPNETIHRSISSYTVCYEELRTYVTFTNMMGIILLTFYSKGAEEQSSGTQIFNGAGTIVAKNQGLVSAVGNELSYLMQQAKEASENMSEAQKQKTIERLKKAGEDFLNSAAYKDWESDQNIKKS